MTKQIMKIKRQYALKRTPKQNIRSQQVADTTKTRLQSGEYPDTNSKKTRNYNRLIKAVDCHIPTVFTA